MSQLNGVNTNGEYGNNSEECLISMLNDDCIDSICRLLPVTELINFAYASPRFYNIVQRLARVKFAYVNTNMFFRSTVEFIRTFLKFAGEYIKTLDITYLPTLELYTDIGDLCRNVKKLKVFGECLDTNAMISFMYSMESLENLSVYCSNIDDAFFVYLGNFKRLKSLSIVDNQEVTGKFISQLHGLESLRMGRCFSLTPANFRDICISLKNLKHLDIIYTAFEINCKTISNNLLHLEGLKLTFTEGDVSCLAELPNLKKLELESNRTENILLNDFTQLELLGLQLSRINTKIITAVSKLKKLQVLRISSNEICDEFLIKLAKLPKLKELQLSLCKGVTNRALMEIIGNCPKLEQLEMGQCDSLTADIFEAVAKLLRIQWAGNLRKVRLRFSLSYSLFNYSLNRKLAVMQNYADVITVDLKEYPHDSMMFQIPHWLRFMNSFGNDYF